MPGLKLWMLLAAVAGVGLILGAGIAVSRMSRAAQGSLLMVVAPVAVLALHRVLYASIRRSSSSRRITEPSQQTDPHKTPRRTGLG